MIIMLREAQFMILGLITVVFHAGFLSICVVSKDQNYQKICSPSSCGDIRNISYPFRLQGDPPTCGYPDYELTCENNHTMMILGGEKYYVAEINYKDYTVRIFDPGLKDNCLVSSPPHSFGAYLAMCMYGSNYRNELPYYLLSRWDAVYQPTPLQPTLYTIILMNCKQSISRDNYTPIIPCNYTTTTATTGGYYYSSSSPAYRTYAVLGDYVPVGDIPYSCIIGTYMIIQRVKELPEPRILSMSDLQDFMLPGLQLSYFPHFWYRLCQMKGQSCIYEKWNAFRCEKSTSYQHSPNTTEKN